MLKQVWGGILETKAMINNNVPILTLPVEGKEYAIYSDALRMG